MKSTVPLIPMRPIYRGENSVETSKYDKPVYYFNREERSKSEVYIQDGLLLNQHNVPLNFTRIENPLSEKPNIFVIDQDYRLLYHPKHQKRYLHHSSIVAGEPVRFAGSIIVRNGQVIEIIAHSGHYKPSLKQIVSTLYWLQSRGLNLNSAYISGPTIEQAYGVKSVLITKIFSDTYRFQLKSLIFDFFKRW